MLFGKKKEKKKILIIEKLTRENIKRLTLEFPIMHYDSVYVKNANGTSLPNEYTNVIYNEDASSVDGDKYYLGADKADGYVIKEEEVTFDGLKKPYVKYNFGQLNPDKTFCVFVPEEKNGLFYFVNYFSRLLDLCEKNGLEPVVDMSNFRNLYIADDNLGKLNAWENYFENFTKTPLKEVYSSANVIIASQDMNSITYDKFGNGERINIYNKYFKLSKNLNTVAEKEIERLGLSNRRVLGVLCRGTDYLTAYKHAIPLDAHEMAEVAIRHMFEYRCDYVFLSTEDQGILDYFISVFGDKCLYTNQQRFSNIGNEKIGHIMRDVKDKRENDEYLRGEEYFITIHCLSKCHNLTATHCAGTRAAIVLNGNKYEHVNVMNKGISCVNGDNPLYVESCNKNLVSIKLEKAVAKSGITMENDLDGKLHIHGTATDKVTLWIGKRIKNKLNDGVIYSMSIKGFENYDVNDAHFTMKTYSLNEKGEEIESKWWCKDAEHYRYDKKPEYYDLYVVFEKGVKIDSIISVQLEIGKNCTSYIQSHTSITEIAIKDDKNEFYELKYDDRIDIANGILKIDAKKIPIHNGEYEKLRKVVRYEGGCVNYKYKGSYLDNELII